MAIKFNLPQLSNAQKKNLAAGAVMACVFCYMYLKFVWLPWSHRIAEDRQQTRDVQYKIASAQQEAKHLEMLEKEMQALNLQTLDAEKRLPKTRDMPTVFDTLNRFAQKYKVQLVSFSPGAVATKTYFIEIAYQISLTGKYHDVGRYLAAISTAERIYNIKDVSFNGAGGDDKAKLTVNFTLLAYQYRG
jgi:type IV pilus assembly protein PilO